MTGTAKAPQVAALVAAAVCPGDDVVDVRCREVLAAFQVQPAPRFLGPDGGGNVAPGAAVAPAGGRAALVLLPGTARRVHGAGL